MQLNCTRNKFAEKNATVSCPEKELLLAIVSRAIRDAYVETNWQFVESPQERGSIKRSALEWLHSRQEDEWSFIWICSHFDIEPELFIQTLKKKLKIGYRIFTNTRENVFHMEVI